MHQTETALQYIPNGLPVNTSCFHSHVGLLLRGEPLGHILQVSRESAKAALLPLHPAAFANDDARRNTLLVHVQSATPGMNDFHIHLPWVAAGSRGKEGKLPYGLTSDEVSQFVVPLRSKMQTLSRVRIPSDVTPSADDAPRHFHTVLRP